MSITALPYELHPEIPVGGLSLRERWGARYGEASNMYARIAAECEAAGLPFKAPERVPNTRRALQTAEWVRRNAPDSFRELDRSLFTAHFVDNRPLDDPDLLDELVTAAGADAAAARDAVKRGDMAAPLAESMTMANEIGVTGTPAWLINRKFLLPGAQPHDVIERVVQRLSAQPSS